MKTVKVKFVQSCAGHANPQYDLKPYRFAAGDTATISEELAKHWVAAGICTLVVDTGETSKDAEIASLRAQLAELKKK